MRYIKDPLALFLLLGVVIFAVDELTPDEAGDTILVGELDIARLSDQWSAQMGRAPTETELAGLVDAHVREEMLVREALRMGLDTNDVIIRRRLAQKLTFLTEDLALLERATQEQLVEFFESDLERYRIPARYTFSHIYFSPDRRETAREDAAAALAEVTDDTWRTVGDPFMLRRTYAHVTIADIRKDFGTPFSEALPALEGDGWLGPVESGYGYHLVRIDRRTASRLPAFEEVSGRVATDYDTQRRSDANERYYESLAARYRVEVETPAAPTDDAQPAPRTEGPDAGQGQAE